MPASGPHPGWRSATVSTASPAKRSGLLVATITCGNRRWKRPTVRTAMGSPSTAANALSRPPMREASPPARMTRAVVTSGKTVLMGRPWRAGSRESTVDKARRRDDTGDRRMNREGLEALEAAAECLARARYAIALTGAGLSVESGIPPFRGPGGLWTKHGEPPMNGFQLFLADPRRAWEERLNPTGPMRELWSALAAARPNPGHVALVELEEMGVLRA